MTDRYFSIQTFDSTFKWTSKEIVNVTGYTCEEMLGKNPYSYFHKDDLKRIVNKHMNALGIVHDCKIQDLKYRWKHKNGKFIWCQAYFVKYEDGLTCLTRKLKLSEIINFKIHLMIQDIKLYTQLFL